PLPFAQTGLAVSRSRHLPPPPRPFPGLPISFCHRRLLLTGPCRHNTKDGISEGPAPLPDDAPSATTPTPLRGGPAMAEARSRLLFPLGLVALIWLSWPAGAADACPFCQDEKGPTLVGDYNQAALVLYGSFIDFKPNTGDDFNGETTFLIEKVLKSNDI